MHVGKAEETHLSPSIHKNRRAACSHHGAESALGEPGCLRERASRDAKVSWIWRCALCIRSGAGVSYLPFRSAVMATVVVET